MQFGPAPTAPVYPFLIAEVSGAGGSGKTFFACSACGMGDTAFFYSDHKIDTMTRFSRWSQDNGRKFDAGCFGVLIESSWDKSRVKEEAQSAIDSLFQKADQIIASGYSLTILDSASDLKRVAFLAEHGTLVEPLTVPTDPNRKPFVNRMKVYGPVNGRLNQFYDKFRLQPLRADGKGTSLIITTEGRQVYTSKGEETNEYEPTRMGRIEFAAHFRVTVGGPGQKEFSNSITYHRGGVSVPIGKLGKPLPRREFPEAAAFILGVDPADWGRGPDVPPNFAAQVCDGCGKDEGLRLAKVDGEWLQVEENGSIHECPVK